MERARRTNSGVKVRAGGGDEVPGARRGVVVFLVGAIVLLVFAVGLLVVVGFGARNVGVFFGFARPLPAPPVPVAAVQTPGFMAAAEEIDVLVKGIAAAESSVGVRVSSIEALAGVEGVKLRDPWGAAYRFERSADGKQFRVWSVGPDGKDNTVDDIESGWQP